MKIEVNGNERDFEAGSTLAAVVDVVCSERRGKAVAVNEQLVPRSLWEHTAVMPGDRVEVLTATQGG